jgi:hypothetical protein
MDTPRRGLSGKEVVLGVATILFAWFFSTVLMGWLHDLSFPGFLFLVVALVIWLSAEIILFFISKHVSFVFWILVAQAFAMWLALNEKGAALIFLAVVVIFVFLLLQYFRTRRYLENAIEIKFIHIGSRIIPSVMTGLALFLALYLVGVLLATDLSMPKETFSFFLKGAEPVVQRFIPEFAIDQSVDEAIRSVLKKQAPDASISVINKAVEDVKGDIADATGITLTGAENVLDALHLGIVQKLLSLQKVSQLITLIFIAFIIFSVVKGVAFILNQIVIFTAFALYRLLLALKVVTFDYSTREKQEIVLH